MYASHFGLRKRPFRTVPDTAVYYPAATHEAALGQLQYAVQDEEGIALLTGDPGSGKTLLLHRLLESLPPEVKTAFVSNGHCATRADLLQAILFDLGQPYQGKGEQELRLALTEHCLEHFRTGGRMVVVVDEAHHLSADLLEELRLLNNLESRQGRAVQVVLAAQPSIYESLAAPELASLRQRLTVRPHLEALDIQESADYLMHHLRLVGGRPERVFGEGTLEMLAREARGVPRRLNQAAHVALGLAWSAGAKEVDIEAVMEALTRLGFATGGEAASESSERAAPGAIRSAPVAQEDEADACGEGCPPHWPAYQPHPGYGHRQAG